MDRRDFMRLSAVGAVGSVMLSTQVFAETETPEGAGGIYFTKEAPGRWKGKEATHAPNVEVSKSEAGVTVKVTTPHEMKGYEHYIIKHVLLDKNYQFIEEKMFDPSKDKVPMSSFTLKEYSGTLHVLSMCNKHDVWVSTTEI